MKVTDFKLDPFVSGIAFLSIPFFVLFITSFIFICGGVVNPFVFPFSVTLSLALIYLLTRNDKKLFLSSILFQLIFLCLALILTIQIYDYGFDGTRYHQDSILRLRDGWNPVYAPEIEARMWVKHFAKGLETIAASIYSTLGNVEASKVTVILIVVSSVFFTYRFLDTYFEFLSKRKKIFLSFILGFSTVVCNQFFSFYVDWAAYSLILILFTTLFCLLKKQTVYDYFVIAMVMFVGINIKFNLFFWILFSLFFFMIYLILSKRITYLKRMFITCFFSALLAVCIGGANPYVTNMLNHGSPFYPLPDKVDLVEQNTPPVLIGKNRIESFFISILSFPKNGYETTETEFIFPWNITLENIHHSGKCDTLLGGYGLFFGWILILSSILYVLTLNANRSKLKYFNFILLFIFLSAFVLPLGWVVRFFPFFYIFPVLMLLYSEYEKKRRFINFFRNFIYLLICANITLSFVVVFGTGIYKRRMVNEYVDKFSGLKYPLDIDFNGNVSFKIKLQEAGIEYSEVPQAKLDTFIFSPPIYVQSSQLLQK